MSWVHRIGENDRGLEMMQIDCKKKVPADVSFQTRALNFNHNPSDHCTHQRVHANHVAMTKNIENTQRTLTYLQSVCTAS